MASYQVKCINKVPRDSPHEGITHLGGDGWKITRAEMINFIQSHAHDFYTFVSGKRAVIGVVQGPNGPYVRSHADGYYNDNLLALYECV